MSEWIRAILLGIVQGLTEFLPVSSSGHLEIINEFFVKEGELNDDLFMTIVVHVGTAFSILYVYWDKIKAILKDIFALRTQSENFTLAKYILLSMIPAVIVGLFLEDFFESIFSGTIFWIGVFLIFTAIILYMLPRLNVPGSILMRTPCVIAIGVAQAIAILPGISRSGATIATALAVGASREKAAEFSFLMVLPLIFGKFFLDIIQGEWASSEIHYGPVFMALFTSFLVGIFACKWMIKIVRNSKLIYFSAYCAIVGILVIMYSLYTA